MVNVDMAKKILSMIKAKPNAFDMATFVGGLPYGEPLSLPIDIEIEDVNICDTTLCVAGWAVAFDGWTIPSAGLPFKKNGEVFESWEIVGRRILGITEDDSMVLFYTSEERATMALEQLVNGAQEIDWEAIDEAIGDDYDSEYDGCPCCNGDSDYWDEYYDTDDDPFES